MWDGFASHVDRVQMLLVPIPRTPIRIVSRGTEGDKGPRHARVQTSLAGLHVDLVDYLVFHNRLRVIGAILTFDLFHSR
jgi:hypothetical protein